MSGLPRAAAMFQPTSCSERRDLSNSLAARRAAERPRKGRPQGYGARSGASAAPDRGRLEGAGQVQGLQGGGVRVHALGGEDRDGGVGA